MRRLQLALLLFLLSGCAASKPHRRAEGRKAGTSDYSKLRQGQKLSAWKQGYLMGVIQCSDEDTIVILDVIQKDKK